MSSKRKEADSGRRESTLAALLKGKPKRGRPRSSVSRQSVYVALSRAQKKEIDRLAGQLPEGLKRADIPDIAVILLSTRFELLQKAVAGRNREIPEGITDLDSLYLLWDLTLPAKQESDDNESIKWTSIRLSPQQVIEFGRVQGILNAIFGANRSEVFALALALFSSFAQNELNNLPQSSLKEIRGQIHAIYL